MLRQLNYIVFNCEIVSDSPGLICWKFSGERVYKLFKKEVGGHRWQRVPPTEKSDRIQTSSVTVSVLKEVNNSKFTLNDDDCKIDNFISSGKGGQHMQKNATAVRITHIPTGLVQICESERSLQRNINQAKKLLAAKLFNELKLKESDKLNRIRSTQIGTGYRGDKIRTVQEKNNKVINHLNNKSCSLKDYLKGKLELIQ